MAKPIAGCVACAHNQLLFYNFNTTMWIKSGCAGMALMLPLLAGATTLGLHLVSRHDAPGFNDANTGVYALFDNGFTVGTFRNSEDRRSLYAGMSWQTPLLTLMPSAPLSERWEGAVTAGVITGYWKNLAPMLVPSVVYAVTSTVKVRAAVLFKVNKTGGNAVHLMVEKEFR